MSIVEPNYSRNQKSEVSLFLELNQKNTTNCKYYLYLILLVII